MTSARRVVVAIAIIALLTLGGTLGYIAIAPAGLTRGAGVL